VKVRIGTRYAAAVAMKRHEELMRARELHRRSREQFSKAHEHGLDALKRHDYRALDDAIAEEASAIAKHARAMQQLNDVIEPTEPVDE
jgi:hypothetical protein